MEKSEKITASRPGFWERWEKKAAEREKRMTANEVNRRLQVRECWGTLFLTFDGIPLLSFADLGSCGIDIPSDTDICDLLSTARNNMNVYLSRRKQGYDE